MTSDTLSPARAHDPGQTVVDPVQGLGLRGTGPAGPGVLILAASL